LSSYIYKDKKYDFSSSYIKYEKRGFYFLSFLFEDRQEHPPFFKEQKQRSAEIYLSDSLWLIFLCDKQKIMSGRNKIISDKNKIICGEKQNYMQGEIKLYAERNKIICREKFTYMQGEIYVYAEKNSSSSIRLKVK
jgi:hypothetical protein